MLSVTADEIGQALRGRKSGTGWVAHCPAHNDHRPSLSIREADDGKILVHCHAGCEQERVIAALRSRGLWPGKGTQPPKHSAAPQTATSRSARDDTRRTSAALAIWEDTFPAEGTPVEAYLTSRCLSLSIPESIRFHKSLKHPSGRAWPAMVALVSRGADDEPIGIHRTYLERCGEGKAPIDPQRMMLGPCRGGAVKLAPSEKVLMVGEGIETCLAAMQARGLPAWAALSTSGIRSLELPSVVEEVIVLADGDNAGEEAAMHAAQRWRDEGLRVRIARPPRGYDFNDVLMGRVSHLGEAA